MNFVEDFWFNGSSSDRNIENAFRRLDQKLHDLAPHDSVNVFTAYVMLGGLLSMVGLGTKMKQHPKLERVYICHEPSLKNPTIHLTYFVNETKTMVFRLVDYNPIPNYKNLTRERMSDDVRQHGSIQNFRSTNMDQYVDLKVAYKIQPGVETSRKVGEKFHVFRRPIFRWNEVNDTATRLQNHRPLQNGNEKSRWIMTIWKRLANQFTLPNIKFLAEIRQSIFLVQAREVLEAYHKLYKLANWKLGLKSTISQVPSFKPVLFGMFLFLSAISEHNNIKVDYFYQKKAVMIYSEANDLNITGLSTPLVLSLEKENVTFCYQEKLKHFKNGAYLINIIDHISVDNEKLEITKLKSPDKSYVRKALDFLETKNTTTYNQLQSDLKSVKFLSKLSSQVLGEIIGSCQPWFMVQNVSVNTPSTFYIKREENLETSLSFSTKQLKSVFPAFEEDGKFESAKVLHHTLSRDSKIQIEPQTVSLEKIILKSVKINTTCLKDLNDFESKLETITETLFGKKRPLKTFLFPKPVFQGLLNNLCDWEDRNFESSRTRLVCFNVDNATEALQIVDVKIFYINTPNSENKPISAYIDHHVILHQALLKYKNVQDRKLVTILIDSDNPENYLYAIRNFGKELQVRMKHENDSGDIEIEACFKRRKNKKDMISMHLKKCSKATTLMGTIGQWWFKFEKNDKISGDMFIDSDRFFTYYRRHKMNDLLLEVVDYVGITTEKIKGNRKHDVVKSIEEHRFKRFCDFLKSGLKTTMTYNFSSHFLDPTHQENLPFNFPENVFRFFFSRFYFATVKNPKN